MGKENCPCDITNKSINEIMRCPEYHNGSAKPCVNSSVLGKKADKYANNYTDGIKGKDSLYVGGSCGYKVSPKSTSNSGHECR
jgi:hypothetical protein